MWEPLNLWNLPIAFIVENGSLDLRLLITIHWKVLLWHYSKNTQFEPSFKLIQFVWANIGLIGMLKQNNVLIIPPPFFREIKQQMAYFNTDKNMPLWILLFLCLAQIIIHCQLVKTCWWEPVSSVCIQKTESLTRILKAFITHVHPDTVRA